MMAEVGSLGDILMQINIGFVHCSEKLLNLDILLMHVADLVSHYKALAGDREETSSDSVVKAVEFDILSGILGSELEELDKFIVSLEQGLFGAWQKISCECPGGTSVEMENKLHDCEEFLKKSREQVAEIRMQSNRFENARDFAGKDYLDAKVVDLLESSRSPMNAKMISKTAEKQRIILRMMEKSLERELDLEKRLSESKCKEEEFHLKLNNVKQEISSMEETKDLISEKFLEAENASTVLMGISKELMGRLQIIQFNLNSSIKREAEARLKLEGIAEVETLQDETIHLKAKLKEAEDKCRFADADAVNLQDKINSLEGQLRESNNQLERTRASFEESQEQQILLSSEISDLESVIEDLRQSVSKAESRAESVESKCKLLAETNLELNGEIGLLKTNSDKVKLLEKQLRQSETHLQHAKASIEASKEKQIMLFSAIGDMEKLIEDLKVKSSKAEARAENADSKCILLTEMNSELNEELFFLRGRVDCLETSLHQANVAKIAAAKDIGVKAKAIADLVMQLAKEREHLRTQISSLTKQLKYWEEKNASSVAMINNGNENVKGNSFFKNDSPANPCTEVLEDVSTGPPSTNTQVGKLTKDVSVSTVEAPSTLSIDESSIDESLDEVSKLEPVRSIEAGQLNSKHALLAFLILLVSILAVYIFQQGSCPF